MRNQAHKPACCFRFKFASVAGGDEVHSGALTFHYHTDDGFSVITWISGSNAYALVSDVTGSARILSRLPSKYGRP